MDNSGSSDFFQYGRGYALYTQGMTDVGRRFSKNLKGEEINAPAEELAQAAIERDTLLLARAVGPGMSMDEYRDLQDQVQLLHKHYRDHKLTNEAYQDKLWSLPGRVQEQRNKASTDPHYKPERDKMGHPIDPSSKKSKSLAKMRQHAAEKMKKLAPEMGQLPPIDLKSLMESAQRDAGVPVVGDSRTLPKDFFHVPHHEGAPPVKHPSPAGHADSSIPPAARQRGGFWNQIQAGLDAVGIVEPTPFADGTNAGISAIRALTDPKNAGTHLRNAGISLVSAAVPYLGDTAKLLKYGGRAAAHEGGSVAGAFGRAGRAGTVTNTILGMLGAGAAGGAGGGGGPPRAGSGGASLPGSGSHGGRGGSGGQSGSSLFDALTGSFMNLIRAMGPWGTAVAGAVVGVKGFVHWMGRVDESSRKLIEENRQLANYDGALAGSYAQLRHDRLIRSFDRAHEMSGPLGKLTRTQSSFEDAKHEWLLPYEQLFTSVKNAEVWLTTQGVKLIDLVDPVNDFFRWWYSKDQEEKASRNAYEHMAKEAIEKLNLTEEHLDELRKKDRP